jgi:autotransporter-associated beta strand protein
VVAITTGAVDAPSGLTATASIGAVQLTWTNNPDATGYNIKRATVSGGPYTQIGSTASTTYNDTSVTNGTEYFYIVNATAAGFESQPSDEVSARPLPPSGNGVWTADSGGNWSNAENWQSFVVADGAGNSATFGQTGGGTITLDTTGRALGSLAFSNGTYELAGSPLTLDATTGAPVVSVGTGVTATIGAALAGAEGLEKTGAGRLIVATDSAITGATTVTAGTLTHRGLHGSNAFAIAAGAVFEMDTTAAALSQVSTTFTGAGTLRKTGANRVYWGSSTGTFGLATGALIDVQGGTFTGGSSANENWTNNKADLNVASGAIFDGVEANVRVDGISGSGTIRTGYNGAGYANFTIGVDNGSSTFSGVIANSSSTGHLVKEGSGTITLAGNNTYTGSTTIKTGILQVSSGSNLGGSSAGVTFNGNNTTALAILDGFSTARPLTLANGSNTEFRVAAGASATWSGTIAYGDSASQIRVANGAGGTLILQGATSNATSSANSIVLASGNLVLHTGFTLGSTNGNLLLGRGLASALTAKGTSSTSLGPILLNTSTATPSATLTLQDSAAMTGTSLDLNNNGATSSVATVNLNGGTLTVASIAKTRTGASQTATFNLNGGELKPSASSTTFWNSLSGTTARVKIGGAKIHTNNFDITIAQALLNDTTLGSTPDGGLTKNGTGVLTLSANNTYTGPTIVNGGSLVANTAAKLGTSHLTVNTGATCDLRNTAGAIADAAHVYLNGTGKLIIAGGVTETVARLYVNNAQQAAGTYTAATHPALVSGSGSLVVSSSLPVAPTALAATAVSHQTIDLAWTDNEVGETGYLVERSATAGSGFTQIASLPANTTSYSDTSLSANTTRFYRVRAAGGSGNSAYSNVASATTLPTPPAAPTGPVATAGGFAVRLEWTAVPAATAYRIKRSTISGSGFTEIGTTTATSFIDGNLAAGVPVFYQIAAETSGSIGANSSELTATPLAFVQWDGGDLVTAGAQGGNGPWNSAALWWNGFSNAAWPASGLTNEAIFGGNAGTVTLDPAGLAANRLTFNTTGYLLQNGPLTLNGTAPAVFIATGVTAQISAPISGTAGLIKSGPGSLALTGSNIYGNTAIQQGILQLNSGASLGAGSITLGTGVAGTLGTVGNLTFNTDATVGAISAVSNTSDTTTPANIGQLLVASGRTLTASSLSAGLSSSSAGSTRTALATGSANSGGALKVNGNVIIGGSGATNSTLTAVDLSGLGSFNLNAPSGHLRIGYGSLTKGTLTLAANNMVNTSTISVGETINSGNSSQFSTLNLGSGANTIQTNDLRIGFEKTAGVVQFAGPGGSVSITGNNGAGKTAIAVGRATGASYQGIGTNSLLLAGHPATVNASTVVVGRKGTGSSAGNIASLLTFDTGTFTADEIQLGVAAFGNAGTSATGTFNLGTNSASTGILTVNGDFILASNTNTTNAQTAVGTFTINGGTANVFGAIKDDSTTTLGTSTTTLTLDGGTLDMNANPIGGDGTPGNLAIDTLNFRSGTLKDVSQINNGSTGLNKTTGGTLTLSGTHTFTAPTTISAGKLVLDGTIAGDLTATAGTLAVQREASVGGALAIPSGGTFEATPGVSFTAAGNVTLAGNLDLIPTPGLSVGESFTLLEKISPGAITGTFAGKPEASTFTANGYNWQISYLGGDGNDVTLTIVPASAIETWRQSHFGITSNTGNAADTFDSNNDGENNLIEFATSQNPHAATLVPISLTHAPGSMLEFTYTRNKAAFDAGYLFVVQYSDTLAPNSWTSAGPASAVLDGPTQTVKVTLPAGSAGRRFMRLNVSAP